MLKLILKAKSRHVDIYSIQKCIKSLNITQRFSWVSTWAYFLPNLLFFDIDISKYRNRKKVFLPIWYCLICAWNANKFFYDSLKIDLELEIFSIKPLAGNQNHLIYLICKNECVVKVARKMNEADHFFKLSWINENECKEVRG